MKWNKRIMFWVSLAILTAAVVFVTLPLLKQGFFVSDDGGWLLIRFTAFYQSLREGQFPVRFLGRLNFGYGYPVANFNYPGFMYIGSLIHLSGIGFVDTVKIILGGSVLFGSLFTFLWLRVYFGSLASVTGALGFTFAPYLLHDIYRRGSIGEVLAMACAAMGLYGIASNKKWLFGLAVPLLILSHNTLALLFLAVFGLYITVRGVWREFFFMFAVGIGMGAFFWVPALHERKYIAFDSITVSNPVEYLISASNIRLLGLAGILAAIVSLTKKKFLNTEKVFFIIIFALSLFMVLPVSSPLWQLSQFTRLIQFPFRLLSVTIFAGAWLTAYVIQRSTKLHQLLLMCVFVLIGLWGVSRQLNSVIHINEPEGYYTTNESTSTIADEYMPKWVIRKPMTHAPERLLFYKGRGSIQVNHLTTQTVDVVVEAQEDSVIQINTLYYPGWGASVDNTRVRIDYSNNEDVIRVPVPAGRHHVMVTFRETISRFLADCLSLVSLVTFGILVILEITQKRKKK